MNNFEELCKLASDENWCWNLFCTTCGHLHFKYAFSELAAGKSPIGQNWLIHRRHTSYMNLIGALPRNYTEKQKEQLHCICYEANISAIAAYCKFPDWLGYLGLILVHMNSQSKSFISLSCTWASQLSDLGLTIVTLKALILGVEPLMRVFK